MFAVTKFSSFQSAIFMLTAAVIVAASLSVGAWEAQSKLHPGYSVTITELQ